jgi:outer membrane protein TolC
MHSIEAARLQVRAERLRIAPTLNGFGRYHEFSYTAYATQEKYVWAVGVSLDWKIFDAGVRDANRRLVESQMAENRIKLDSLRDTISDELSRARIEIEGKRRALDTAERAVSLARDGLQQIRVQHETGVASQLDLLTAQESVVAAEVERAQSRFQLALAEVDLRRAAGLFP